MNRSLWQSLGLVCVMAVAARGAEYGSLTGQIVYDGEAPLPAKLNITKDVEFCGPHMPVSEELLVDPETKGISNVVIFVFSKVDEKDVHPDMLKDLPSKVSLDNKNCRFEPHVLSVWVGKQTLEIGNSDPISHNSNMQPIGNPGTNPLLPSNSSIEYKFTKKTNLPAPVACNIHPWMSAYVVARDNPYTVVTGIDGKFNLENVPVGKHEIRVWQEKCGYLDTKEFPKGKLKFDVKPGTNDFGVVKVSPKLFEKK